MEATNVKGREMKFIARGIVYGNCWGGGRCGYAARQLQNTSLDALLDEAQALLKSGGLDGGMGFESLRGACLEIEKIELITLADNKVYTRSEFEIEFLGDLDESEQDFLIENLNCQQRGQYDKQ